MTHGTLHQPSLDIYQSSQQFLSFFPVFVPFLKCRSLFVFELRHVSFPLALIGLLMEDYCKSRVLKSKIKMQFHKEPSYPAASSLKDCVAHPLCGQSLEYKYIRRVVHYLAFAKEQMGKMINDLEEHTALQTPAGTLPRNSYVQMNKLLFCTKQRSTVQMTQLVFYA